MLYGGVVWEDRAAVLEQAGQVVASTDGVFEEHARNVFETHGLIARQVNEHIRGLSWDEIGASQEIHAYLAGIAHEFPQVQSLWLIDRTGTVRNSSVVFPVPSVTVIDRDYFGALREQDTGTFIGPLVHGRVVKDDIFNVAQRRDSGSGSFDGVVVVSASPSYFIRFWQRTDSQPGSAVSLIRKDGSFLARHPRVPANKPRLDPDSKLMKAIANSPVGAYRSVSVVDGQDRIYAYRNVTGFPVYVGYGVSMAAALAPWHRHLILYGEFFLLDLAGLALFALIAASRARREAAALTVAARFRGMIEAAPDPLIVAGLDGRITFVNNRALAAFGYDATEMLDRFIEDLIPKQFKATDATGRSSNAAASLGQAITAGVPLLALRKDGIAFPVDVSLSPLEVDGKKLVMALVRDITERKQMEASIESSRMQVVASARLSALGTMAGGIAHEINNPLMIIHATASDLADLAEDADVGRDAVLRCARRIELYSDRIARIIKSMLRLARDGTSDPFAEGKLTAIVEQALDICGQRFRDHAVDLAVSAIDPSITIRGRDVQLAQIVCNLLQNALDAVLEQPAPRWVRLETARHSDSVSLSVIDSGPGIPPEVKARIMEPFFTTKPVGKGTGLGLSVSQQIAQEHGGGIEVCEQDGHTCISLSLPLLALQQGTPA